MIEKPKDIASTKSSVAGNYEAHFTHTFNSSGAGQSGLEDANINEKFDSLTAKTPFGDDFTLKANAAGSRGLVPEQLGPDEHGRQGLDLDRRHRRRAVHQERFEPRARQEAPAGLRR